MPATMLRLMGESDIIDIDPAAHDSNAHPRLMGLDADDRINLLGHWLDQDRGEEEGDGDEHEAEGNCREVVCSASVNEAGVKPAAGEPREAAQTS